MTYEQAISWIDSRQWSGTGKGIVRSGKLLALLENPHKKLKFIHVAGTNGKGSVSACLSKILTVAGYRTGLQRPDHVQRRRDRGRGFCADRGAGTGSGGKNGGCTHGI